MSVDPIPPVVTCPDDIEREVPLNVPSVSVTFPEATATDNSGIANLVDRTHSPGQQFSVGSTTVTYTFEDPSNNRASCSFTILVLAGKKEIYQSTKLYQSLTSFIHVITNNNGM